MRLRTRPPLLTYLLPEVYQIQGSCLKVFVFSFAYI